VDWIQRGGSFEHDNDLFGLIKDGEFLDELLISSSSSSLLHGSGYSYTM
jgi:hypothetical protein